MMNQRMKMVGGALAGTLLLLGIFGAAMEDTRDDKPSDEVSPAPTVTVTKTVTPRPKPSLLPNARSSSEDGAAALTQVAIAASWRQLTGAERTALCGEWRADSYTTLEAFMEEAGDAPLDAVTVRGFFTSKCGTGG